MPRKKAKTRTIVRYKKPKKTFKRKAKGHSSDMRLFMGAAAYGGLRARLSGWLLPFTAKIPAGAISDEIGLLALNWGMMKGKIPGLKSIKLTRDIGKAGFTIESARIGEYLADRMLQGQAVTGQNSF